MPSSLVEIMNVALSEIGVSPLSSPTDRTKQARLCNRHYPVVRDATLRAHTWNCATTRRALSVDATTPVFGWDTAFVLPTDYLRLIATNDELAEYSIEGRRLLMNVSSVSIQYIFRLEDVTQFDVLLADAISTRLASELAMSLKGSVSHARDLFRLYEAKLAEARLVDSMESPTVSQITGDSWTLQRTGRDEPFRKISAT